MHYILCRSDRETHDLLLVSRLDPSVLTHDMTHSLLDILPNSEGMDAMMMMMKGYTSQRLTHQYSAELALVKGYTSCAPLDQVGRLLFHLNRVPCLLDRLELHEICFSWIPASATVSSQLRVILSACEELDVSQDLLKKLLSM